LIWLRPIPSRTGYSSTGTRGPAQSRRQIPFRYSATCDLSVNPCPFYGMTPPRLGIDRNAYARILNALEAIERGTYRTSREKGKQGIPRTVARVLKALLNLALQYGEVRPSLVGIARLACACKQTVVNCLKLLSFYGFVIVHRRIKRIRTPLGFKVVQDTNAYRQPWHCRPCRNFRRSLYRPGVFYTPNEIVRFMVESRFSTSSAAQRITSRPLWMRIALAESSKMMLVCG
jgi:hypothetical protein